MTRVILFEDNKNFADTFKDYFEDSDTVFLTQTFSNATNATAHIKTYHPDVVLMDIEMPGISGLDAMEKISKTCPDTRVLIQTQFEDEHRIFVALCRGACGYALKTDSLEKIEAAIIDVHHGGGYFSPRIAEKIARFFQNPQVRANPTYVELTRREKEVINYFYHHPELTYDGIAFELGITTYGVSAHIKNIYKKLHVNSKPEAIMKAIDLKLIP